MTCGPVNPTLASSFGSRHLVILALPAPIFINRLNSSVLNLGCPGFLVDSKLKKLVVVREAFVVKKPQNTTELFDEAAFCPNGQ